MFSIKNLFHFTVLRDANLSNPKCFGKKFCFMEFQNSKHSCQNMPLLLMIFYWEIWGIIFNIELEWRKEKKGLKSKYCINLNQLHGSLFSVSKWLWQFNFSSPFRFLFETCDMGNIGKQAGDLWCVAAWSPLARQKKFMPCTFCWTFV